MNKLGTNSPTFAVSPEPKHRLLVLVPDSEANISSAAKKILELANALGSQVHFLGLYRDEAREPSLRRQIISISSMVGGETKIEFGKDWLEIIEPNWSEGDAIACIGEQQVGLAKRPLSHVLESRLKATVYVFTEFQVKPRQNWLASALGWGGSLALIALFSLAQVKLTSAPQVWQYTALLYLSIFAEAGSVWAWNNLFEAYT